MVLLFPEENQKMYGKEKKNTKSCHEKLHTHTHKKKKSTDNNPATIMNSHLFL